MDESAAVSMASERHNGDRMRRSAMNGIAKRSDAGGGGGSRRMGGDRVRRRHSPVTGRQRNRAGSKKMNFFEMKSNQLNFSFWFKKNHI